MQNVGGSPDTNENISDVTVSGSEGEGGGQIVRIALPLAMLLSRSVRITDVRKGRSNPGLRPQHVASAQLVAQVASACLLGAHVSSSSIFLEPGNPVEQTLPLKSTVGTAGATSLVLQAALPVALRFLPGYDVDGSDVTMRISGGTSVQWSPPSDYVKYVLIPNLRHFGVQLRYDVARHGFYPQGRGECSVTIDKSQCPRVVAEDGSPGRVLRSCILTHRGYITSIKGSLIVRGDEYQQLGVVDSIVRSVVQVLRRFTRNHEGYPSFDHSDVEVQLLSKLDAKDNSVVLTLYARSSCGTVLGSSVIWNAGVSFKERGNPKRRPSGKRNEKEERFERWRNTAASSGQCAAEELCDALESMAVVDVHMADQLCILMAMGSGTSRLLVPHPSQHLSTAIHVIKQFGIAIELQEVPNCRHWELVCEGSNVFLQDQRESQKEGEPKSGPT
ncbi:unnamed protein product [Agarophyton chilense]